MSELNRKAFEEWAFQCAWLGLSDECMARDEINGGYYGLELHTAWLAWQASREALEQSTVSPEVLAILKQFEADENAEMQRAEMFIRETGRASISAMQRNFKISYEKACRLMDKLVERGVVSLIDAEGRRTVLPAKVSQ